MREGEGSSALVREELMRPYLAQNGLTLFWIFISERCVWPGGDNDRAAWRRSNGLSWMEGDTQRCLSWHTDEANGTSRDYLPSMRLRAYRSQSAWRPNEQSLGV